jgi:glycosyltransferase involved in cell wall biosynthesis
VQGSRGRYSAILKSDGVRVRESSAAENRLMKILQICNFNNHLQSHFITCMQDLVGRENFLLAETKGISSERLKLGWKKDFPEINHTSPSRRLSDNSDYSKWVRSADVLISGEKTLAEFETRARLGLPSFYMSERWWKPPLGKFRLLHPRFLWNFREFRILAMSEHLWFLAIGDKASTDIARMLGFGQRKRRWGYFPPVHPNSLKLQETAKPRILWAGRFLSWKRVDVLIKAFRKIVEMGIQCELELIGDGPARQSIQILISKLSLNHSVKLLPAMSQAEILSRMQLSEVYVLPSLGQEGWGAVINEAMASGCIVLGSKESGACGSLVEDGYSGFLLEDSTIDGLASKLAFIITNIKVLRRVRLQAVETIQSKWSAKVAASRLHQLSLALAECRTPPVWEDGPVSVIGA